MTKKELVEGIQRAEAAAWKTYQDSKVIWGKDDVMTARCSAKWLALFELREALGLDPMPVAQLVTEGLLPETVAA
jgi:hypothetical protein